MYSIGSWIVHAYYGVGQIKDVEVKSISGEETPYFRIQSSDSTFWVPVDQVDSEIIRPLSTSTEIREAVVILQKEPETMSSNYKARQSRIQKVRLRNTPKAIARLIRDLRARRREKNGLNNTERTAFGGLKQRFIEEWAIVVGKEAGEVESRLNMILDSK